MVVFSFLLLLCVLLPAIVPGRTLPKNYRYSFDYLNDKVYDFSDNISILPYFYRERSGSRSLKQSMSASLEMEEASPRCPEPRQKNVVSPSNLYHIGEFRFPVPTKTGAGVRKRKVQAKCGFLFGLSDFTEIPPFDEPRDTSSPPELWFSWNRLKAKCEISTVLDELKEGKGGAEVLVEPLYMLVRVPREEPSSPKIEMTRVKKVTVSFQDFDFLPPEAAKDIRSHIESRMICLMNNEIRDILKDSMKSSIEKQSSDDLTKLMLVRKT